MNPRRELRRFVVFLTVGGTSTVLNLAVVTVLTAVPRWSYLPSALVAYEIGVLFSFVLMERFAFRDMATLSGSTLVRILRFHATYLLGAVVTLAIGDTLVNRAGATPTVAHAVAIAVTTCVNFIVLRLWAYRAHPRRRDAHLDAQHPSFASRDAAVPSPLTYTSPGSLSYHADFGGSPGSSIAPATWAHQPTGYRVPQFGQDSASGYGQRQGQEIQRLSEAGNTAVSGVNSPDVSGKDDEHPTVPGATPLAYWQVDTLKSPKVPRATAAVASPAALPADSPRPTAPLAHPRRTLFTQIPAAIRAMRLPQWTKNGLVVLAMVFARTLTDAPTFVRVTLAFFAFSLAASAIYVVNDLADVEKDRAHPKKRFRPIASGALSLPGAVLTALVCGLGAALLAAIVLLSPFVGAASHGIDPFARYGGGGLLFALALGVYLAQNVLYSLWLKHLVLWDVFSIAFGFFLRALAGAFAADVYISPWFYLCTIFLSLFLALGKRRAELAQRVADGAVGNTRKSLQGYTLQLLDQLLIVVVTCAIIAYSLYTFLGVPGTHQLMITIPFLIFGTARYLYLIYVKAQGEQPDRLLFQDRQILGVVACCLIVAAVILYNADLDALIALLRLPLHL